jgi:hypothetical protein
VAVKDETTGLVHPNIKSMVPYPLCYKIMVIPSMLFLSATLGLELCNNPNETYTDIQRMDIQKFLNKKASLIETL